MSRRRVVFVVVEAARLGRETRSLASSLVPCRSRFEGDFASQGRRTNRRKEKGAKGKKMQFRRWNGNRLYVMSLVVVGEKIMWRGAKVKAERELWGIHVAVLRQARPAE